MFARSHFVVKLCTEVFSRKASVPQPWPVSLNQKRVRLRFLVPVNTFSTTAFSNSTEAVVSPSQGNSTSQKNKDGFGKNSRKKRQEQNIDSFGTWDSTTDLPLAVQQSIASGKPIPSIYVTSIGVSSMKGRRPTHEDQYGFEQINESFLYFAVFDGHGGADCAKFCANAFPKNLSYWFQQGTDTTTAIHNCFVETNNAFAKWFAHNQKGNETGSSGSTATVCLLQNSVDLYIGHVGDSRAIICRSGEPRKLTQDHVPSLIMEKERIEKSGGRCSQTRVNERLAMTRSIGDLDLKRFGVIAEPEIRTMRIDHSRDAFLVLTTDGINNVMSDKEIVETVKQTNEPQYAATLLTETAFQYSSEDNITSIVIPLGSWGKYSAAATIFHSFGKSMSSSSRFS
ncbi:Protein phosphatase 1K, mitochondrial [Orchesella cincta]|uniref:Protein phosphatase 1K, mitochondrial n=1 Tax=Orchesella cincta TaxID=48709 RepID=A0A1D2NL65_ORCCI|nr:Protein phosphatase 1K, mitochondrial [Orchesella cincta]